jgi:hypothetical protein
MTRKSIIIRDIHQEECPWLDSFIKKGTVVFECNKCQYGCVTSNGIAVTYQSDGDYPFFEVPFNSICFDEGD